MFESIRWSNSFLLKAEYDYIIFNGEKKFILFLAQYSTALIFYYSVSILKNLIAERCQNYFIIKYAIL